MTRVVLVSDPYHSARIDDIADEVGLDAVTSPTRTSPIKGAAEWRRFGTETLRVGRRPHLRLPAGWTRGKEMGRAGARTRYADRLLRGWCNRQHNRFWSCIWGFESSPPSASAHASPVGVDGLTRHPLKVEITGSNPVRGAHLSRPFPCVVTSALSSTGARSSASRIVTQRSHGCATQLRVRRGVIEHDSRTRIDPRVLAIDPESPSRRADVAAAARRGRVHGTSCVSTHCRGTVAHTASTSLRAPTRDPGDERSTVARRSGDYEHDNEKWSVPVVTDSDRAPTWDGVRSAATMLTRHSWRDVGRDRANFGGSREKI